MDRERWDLVWILLATLCFVIICQWIRPFPFATTDDNWMYFLPLIKAHTDAFLAGHPLKVLWGLGAGWVPWENAQVGIFYFPYHLANLLARLLGQPLAILEVSAWMHLTAAGVITYLMAPRSFSRVLKFGFALLAVFAPGPFLLGLNWHNYLSCYPWFLALAFCARGGALLPSGMPSRRGRLALGLLSLGFFLSAHVQMYVIGLLALAAWILAEAPKRKTLRTLLLLGVAQLPALVPLIFLKVLTMEGNPDWMRSRDDPGLILQFAQSFSGVVHGTLFGNLIQTRDFELWANVSWKGVGMFCSPALVLLLGPILKARKWPLAAFFGFSLVFMGAASFPWIRHLAFGPLEGFRWTWKICIFTGPLAILSLLQHWDMVEQKAKHRGLLTAVAVVLSLFVCVRGLDFEIWPSLTKAHGIGAAGIVRETKAMAAAVGLAPGTRLAILGPLDMQRRLPIPLLGVVGNAATLSGLESAHLYEPMEPESINRGHLGLSLPWRVCVPEDFFLADPNRTYALLAKIGVQAILTVRSEAGALPGSRSFTDTQGQVLWVVPVPGIQNSVYPGTSASPISRTLSGTLSAAPSSSPPLLLSPRPVHWIRTDTGWVGVPETLDSLWIYFAVFLGLATPLALGLRAWDRLDAPLAPDTSVSPGPFP